jgi:hypothetical protein
MIAADTTWRAAEGPHVVTYSISVKKGATLTVEPCTRVVFQGGHGISVEGSLVARGTASSPISFESSDPGTPWGNIVAYSGTIDLAYVTLTNGGSTDAVGPEGVIEVRGDRTLPRQALLTVDHVTVDGSPQYGVSLKSGAAFSETSQTLTVRNTTRGPIRASPRLAGSIPPGTYTGNAVDEIVLVGDEEMGEDTTFHDRGVPYRIGDWQRNGKDLVVGTSTSRAVLTIEPGVTLRMQAESRVRVRAISGRSASAILARGTAQKPVVLTSAAATPAAGDWVGVVFDGWDPQDALDFVRIEYAGAPSGAKGFHCDESGGNNEEDRGALIIFGQPAASFLTNSTIAHSAYFGVDRAWKGADVDFVATNTFVDIARCKQSRPLADRCPAVPCE